MIAQRRCHLESCRRGDPPGFFWPHRDDQRFCDAWCRRKAWRLAHASDGLVRSNALPAVYDPSGTPFTAA